MMSNTHLPRKKKNALRTRLSAKKTALRYEAPNPTVVIASAPAPSASGARESDMRPRVKPITAAVEGLTRTAARSSARIRKSIGTRHTVEYRSASCRFGESSGSCRGVTGDNDPLRSRVGLRYALPDAFQTF